MINADRIGHNILYDEKIKDQIVAYFGKSVLDNHEINRKELGKIVFKDPEQLKVLNALVHPALIKEILRRVEQSTDPMIVIDAALLFQWSMNEICTYVILVTAPEKVKISRLVKHTHITAKEAKVRIRAQQEFPIALADFIIENDGTIKALNERITIIWEKLQQAQK